MPRVTCFTPLRVAVFASILLALIPNTLAISLPEFKRSLGPLAEKLTDDQVEWLFDAECKLADAIIEWWLRKRKGQVASEPKRDNNQLSS
jgi:hypothetical protein